MVPLVTYSLTRLGLLVAAGIALYLVGMRDWLLVLVAAVVAFALSYVLLQGQRDAAARWLAEREEHRMRHGLPRDADSEAEDAQIDRALHEES